MDELHSPYLSEKGEGGPFMDIVTREEWGALTPLPIQPLDEGPRPVIIPMNHISFTHTKTKTCHTHEECCSVVRRIQYDQREVVGLHDITFNFLIGSNGFVYEGRGWYKEPHRPLLYEVMENRGIEIAYIGDFEDISPPPEMLSVAFDFLLYGLKIKLVHPVHQCIHLA